MKIPLLFILILFGAGNTVVQAQKQKILLDTTLAGKWYEQGLILQQKGSHDSANIVFARAALLYKKHRQWVKQIDCENNLARCLVSMGKYEEALQKASQTQQECQAKLGKDNSKEEADALHITGIVYYYKGDYNQAMEFYQKALQLRRKILSDVHPSISSSYNNIGIIHYRKGEYDQALEYYHKDLQISLKTLGKNQLGIAASYANIGNVYFDKGDYDQAFIYTQKAIKIKLEALGEFHPDLANSYNSLGNIYAYKGEFDKALEYNHKALYLWQEALGETHPNVASAYNNIGGIYHDKGDYEKALEYYQKNLRIILKSSDQMHPDIAIVYHNIGNVYDKQGEYDQALQYLQKALNIRQQTLGEFHDDVAESYNSIGEVYYNKGEYDQALGYFQKDLQITLKSLGQINPSLAASYNNIGDVYTAKGEYTHALKQYQQAILANIPSFHDTTVNNNPILTQKAGIYLDGRYLLTSLQAKAGTLEKLFIQSHAIADLQLAYQTYCSADTLARQIQYNYSGENDKVTFTNKAREIYQTALPVCLKLHHLTSEKIYLNKAFYFAERGKASVLSATLAELKAKTFAGIADSLLLQDQQLRTSVADYTQHVLQELTKGETVDSSKLNEYQTLLFVAHRQQEKLISQFEKEYPQYYNLKYQPASVNPAQLQAVLDKKTAVIEYVLADTLLHIFTLTSSSVNVQSFSLDSTFQRKITAFREAILSQDQDLYYQTAYSLYKILLPQALPKSIRQLIIIPEGELTTLPFEALLMQDKKVKKGKPAAYLLNKYAISYAYSARLLYERLSQPKERAGKQLLALAPVFADSLTNATVAINRDILSHHQAVAVKNVSDKANPLQTNGAANPDDAKAVSGARLRGWLLDGQYVSPLPASEREITSIARLFNKQGNTAKVFLHAQAEEEQLKSVDMSKYNYLHLATHGFVNESYPELSGLLLAQDSSSKEDGILYTGEIYNLRLKAELVTLSACETGLGKLAHGEGVIGLTRALLYAGAENIVVSFWKVPDASTADLMEDFYAALLSGVEKAQALQTAKQKMIREGKYTHPFYWAPFVLVGK